MGRKLDYKRLEAEYQRAKFLLVLDNWSETMSLVDYNKLCVASSLNWVEP